MRSFQKKGQIDSVHFDTARTHVSKSNNQRGATHAGRLHLHREWTSVGSQEGGGCN